MPSPWQQLSEHVWLIPGGVNSVVLAHRGRALLVDTGADRDAGNRLVRGLRERDWSLEAIVTTHSHADHIGGHAAVLRRHDVPVFAPALEDAFVRHPELESISLFHGATPPAELTGRWLQAEPSRVDHDLPEGPLELIGLSLEVLAVDGHAPRQRALRVGDVVIAGDAVFGASALARHPLLFAHDVAAQRRSAERIGTEVARLAVPGHGAPDTPARLARATVAAIDRARDAVRAALAAHPTGAETGDLLREVCDALGARIDDLPRWHLNHTTLCAYLVAARAAGEADVRVDAGSLRWFPRS